MKKHFVLSLLAGLGWLSSWCNANSTSLDLSSYDTEVVYEKKERIPPVLPDVSSQFEEGKSFYLYNIDLEKFIGEDLTPSDKGFSFTFTRNDNGFRIESEKGYLYTYYSMNAGDVIGFTSSWNFDIFNIVETEISNIYNIISDLGYCGFLLNNQTFYPGLSSSENVNWTFIAGENINAYEMYNSRKNLYNILCKIDESKYDISYYDSIYDSQISTILEIDNATKLLESCFTLTTNVPKHELSDCPIWIEGEEWGLNKYNKPNVFLNNSDSVKISATVDIADEAALFYKFGGIYDISIMKVYVDGNLIRNMDEKKLEATYYNGYFDNLQKGKHFIEWVFVNNTDSQREIVFDQVGVITTPLISVNLLEPGSLGTEILYNVENVKDVKNLKISGEMNSDDWNKIYMMNNLFSLDLEDVNMKSINDKCFGTDKGRKFNYLYKIVLPKYLESIGEYAFYGNLIEDIYIPESVLNIGEYAFAQSRIKKANLINVTQIQDASFHSCKLLEEIVLSKNLNYIGRSAFNSCEALNYKIYLPNKLEVISQGAFDGCVNLNLRLPESLIELGREAISNTATDSLFVYNSSLNLVDNWSPFRDNKKLVYAEFPTGLSFIDVNSFLSGCGNLNKLVFKSPTVVVRKNTYSTVDDISRVVLKVPNHLINSYKLDSYWYNAFAIEGFETDEIDEWVLNSDLVLGARERLSGTPSVVINTGGSLKINGTDGMPINNLSMQSDPDNKAYGRMFSNADNVTVNGDLWIDFRAGSANKWYFLSLPYNVKVSDIVFTNNNPKHAIRYYDGANRAANGANGSWKNFEEDDIIPAGTGFIFQVSEAGWWKIPAQADESKAYLTSNKMFVKALAANESANASDKGWNLVGNPYQSWYNIHKLNFTAPITVRENNNYAAYSVIDDDYAIAPNQAFFVQCPEGITDISFPLDGRQMTSVIESQTGAKPRTADADGACMRVLTDITVSNGVNTDRTRVVFNESASAEYEINCDASKFMSESADVPQIYSYDEDGIKYAINERPQGNGVVRLGFVAGESGYFTISLTRNMAEKVLLLDKENDVTVDLASQDYGFMSDAGTFENRFELVLRGETTGIDETLNADGVTVVPVKGGIDVSGVNGTVEVYSVSGVKVAGCVADGTDRFFSLPKGGYVVKAGGQSVKVVVM